MPNFPLRIKSSSSCEEKKKRNIGLLGCVYLLILFVQGTLLNFRNLRFQRILSAGFYPGPKLLRLHQSFKIDGFLRPSLDLTGSGKSI